MKENAQNDIIGRLQDKVNGMLTEAMASAALATASMANNQTSDEAILRVELRKLHADFLQNSQEIKEELGMFNFDSFHDSYVHYMD